MLLSAAEPETDPHFDEVQNKLIVMCLCKF